MSRPNIHPVERLLHHCTQRERCATRFAIFQPGIGHDAEDVGQEERGLLSARGAPFAFE
jgi:hypothetical protein